MVDVVAVHGGCSGEGQRLQAANDRGVNDPKSDI